MTPSEYEVLVADLAARMAEIVDGAPPRSVGFGERCKVEGKSGFKHQIDVAISGAAGTLLIECKLWDQHVDVERFLAFAARIVDIRAMSEPVEAAVATTLGFDPGVDRLAAFFGVRTHVVRSADDFALQYRDGFRLAKPGLEAASQLGRPTLKVTDGSGTRVTLALPAV